MKLFRVTVKDRNGRPHKLLVAAETEDEARSIARKQGQVEQVQSKTRSCRFFGGSRVIGAVLLELSS